MFFQIPASLPLGKLPGVWNTKVPESSDKGASSSGAQSMSSSSGAQSMSTEETSVLGKLPAGFMGKLLVYESGAVKMRLGDILLDAVPGSECIFAQDVAAINSVTKQCCFLGDINKRVILVPDVDSLLGNTLEIG